MRVRSSAMAGPPLITLLTDFGSRDAYAGIMKGVIAGIAPAARVVDLTHEVPPQDVRAGAWLLRTAFRHFPPGTVHVAVVDPGVGTARRGIAAGAGGWRFVAPDNGVLSWALDICGDARVVELREPRWFRADVSHTFHGRDVFAPVAAHLASGVPLEALGPPVADPVRIPFPTPDVRERAIVAEVVHVDRFGNCVTALDRATFDAWAAGDEARVEVAARTLALRSTYGEGAAGEALALFESNGYLEVAVRDGSAARAFGLAPGATVTVRRAP